MGFDLKMPRGPEVEFSQAWRRVLSEFLATLLLILFGCWACIPTDGPESMSILFGSLGFGLAVLMAVVMFGHISGAYMNPVISVIAVFWGKIPWSLGIAYTIAQCAGAIAGYGILILLAPIDVAGEAVCVSYLDKDTGTLHALGVEMFLTLGLSLVNCAVFDPINARYVEGVPVKMGLTITILGILGSTTTGPGLNPARSLGPAVWANKWDRHWVYWVGPVVGGTVPAVIYKWVFVNDGLNIPH